MKNLIFILALVAIFSFSANAQHGRIDLYASASDGGTSQYPNGWQVITLNKSQVVSQQASFYLQADAFSNESGAGGDAQAVATITKGGVEMQKCYAQSNSGRSSNAVSYYSGSGCTASLYVNVRVSTLAGYSWASTAISW